VIDADDPEYDDQIAHVLRLAGRRPVPSDGRVQRARDAARVEWQLTLRARGRRRWLTAAAAIAVVGIVSAATWLWTNRHAAAPIERPEIATVRTVVGAVHISDAANRLVTAGSAGTIRQLRAGDRVEVAGQSRAAFQLLDGTSVRLDADTLVTFDSAGRLEMARGGVYIDADPARRPRTLAIETPFGAVSHRGTQFELRLKRESLDVRVREGAVSVDSREGRVTSTAGEALLIRRDRPAERRAIATSGAEWAWVTTMAAPFALEGSTVPSFLEWVSREQGWRWGYADAATRRRAERAVLHGSIDGLTPEEALHAVLPAAGLTSKRDGDRLIIVAPPG
jgi:ferric-dicitrate binding protein FerR (iron transport regulator)